MDMRDNELDKLFQSAINDHEIEPSAHVWTDITARLDADKRKRSLVPFLSIAAGIMLLVTIGILFIPKAVQVNDQHSSKKMAKNTLPVNKVNPVVRQADQQNKNDKKVVIAPVNSLASVKNIKEGKGTVPHKEAIGPEQKPDITKPTAEPELVLATRGNDLVNPVVPDIDNAIKPTVDNVHVLESKPQLTAMQLPPVNKTKAAAPVKRHRIRSLGDVFNVMIAAVDKREDKIIEFSNTDEDDATITGVNLGIIKVKKEK
jgi:hypothetical protein